MKSAVVRAWERLEADPRLALTVVLGLTVVLRLPFLAAPLQPDEGGFLMVAKQWSDDGSALYGDQWVDRPPLLIVVFRLAAMLGGSTVVLRLLALLFGMITVVAAWVAGRSINGARGGVAAAVVAAAISSHYTFDGFALTGESIAVALVMTSCALTLHSTYADRTLRQALALAFVAGMFASMAFLVKQNFVDAGLFAVVFLGVAARRTWRLMVAGAAGIAVPLLVTAAWARSDEGPGLVKLWHAVFRFRRRAVDVVQSASDSLPVGRLVWLVVLFFVSGLVLLVWHLVWGSRRSNAPLGLRPALLVMLGYGLLSVFAGLSWWTHYLLQLGPVLAMGTALATRVPLARLRPQLSIAVVTVASMLGALSGVANAATGSLPGSGDESMGAYLRDASRPGDSVVLTWGTPSVIELSGLSTPYKYSWSLPVRGRDPQLSTLVATLSGPQAPTWLLEIGHFNDWDLDTPAFQRVRATRYHVVATICGHDLYLHNGRTRQLPPQPVCP